VGGKGREKDGASGTKGARVVKGVSITVGKRVGVLGGGGGGELVGENFVVKN